MTLEGESWAWSKEAGTDFHLPGFGDVHFPSYFFLV